MKKMLCVTLLVTAISQMPFAVAMDASLKDPLLEGESGFEASTSSSLSNTSSVSIHDAVRDNNCDQVAQLINDDPSNLELRSDRNYTPLHAAVAYGHEALVNLLLSLGADIEARDNNQHAPLHLAAGYGKLSILKILLSVGANKEAVDLRKCRPVHLAVDNEYEDAVKALIEAGANKFAVNEKGNNFLHFAAYKGHTDLIKYFILEGLNKDSLNFFNWNSLLIAANYGYLDIVNYLLEVGAEKDAFSLKHRVTPLIMATRKGYNKIVTLFINSGADLNHVDIHGMTALHYAVMDSSVENVKLLIDKGADAKAKNSLEETSLDLARKNNNLEIVRLLEVSQKGKIPSDVLTPSKEPSSSSGIQRSNQTKNNLFLSFKELVSWKVGSIWKKNISSSPSTSEYIRQPLLRNSGESLSPVNSYDAIAQEQDSFASSSYSQEEGFVLVDMALENDSPATAIN